MNWEIFLGIVALVGFIITLASPLMKLNGNLVKLNDSIEVLQKAMDKMDDDNEKSHKRLWDHNEEQDKQLKDHENRITKAEHRWEVANALNPHLLETGIENAQNQRVHE